MHLLVHDSRGQNVAQRSHQVHKCADPIARGKRMDNNRHSGNSSAGARAIRKSTHHRRHQRRVIRQKRRRRKDGQLHIHKQGAQGAHQRHGNELFGAPPIRVLKMDMLRLFRHKITCLFHPDSNRWYWNLTSSAGMRTNAHTGRGLIGSAAGISTAPRHPFGTARFTASGEFHPALKQHLQV